MKYLNFILLIVIGATLLSLFFLWPEETIQERDIALTINGHNYSHKAIASQFNTFGYHYDDSDDSAEIVDTIITRQLLIQEAQQQEIDKEESFRDALKKYYEASLIKILLDRQNSKLQITITDNDIDNYIASLGKIVSFTRLEKTPDSEQSAQTMNGSATTALFDDLALQIRPEISTMDVGSYRIMYDNGNESYAIRLDKIEPSSGNKLSAPDRNKIKEILTEHAREKEIGTWLAGLRNRASITIHDEKE